MNPNYLFRKTPRHIFITTQDPEYRYELLCGHCEYPIAAEDHVCPRCQRSLEDCPVCTRQRHIRPPKAASSQDGLGFVCPVCRIRRIAFGDKVLNDLTGSFCTNVYGCSAGGLLLASGEFAVLPENASLCPMCEHETLRPLGVEAFAYHLPRCLFCSTSFGVSSSWAKGWMKGAAHLDQLGEGDQHGMAECPICGRRDGFNKESSRVYYLSPAGSEKDRRMEIDKGRYIRICELGRILILNKDDQAAFDAIFNLWFDPVLKTSEASDTVGEIVEGLLAGTVHPASRVILQKRIEALLEGWGRRLGGVGINYQVSTEILQDNPNGGR